MLCMYICIHAYECAGMRTCVHICGDQSRTLDIFLYWSAAYCFETRSLSELEILPFLHRPPSQEAFRIHLCLPPSAGVPGIHNHGQFPLLLFLVGPGDSNSSP